MKTMLVGFASLLIACDGTGLTAIPVDAFNVSIRISKDGVMMARDGVTPVADSVTIRMTNRRATVAYLPTCSWSLTSVAFSVTHWDGTRWSLPPAPPGSGQIIPCGPGAIRLAPGATLIYARFLGNEGLYRIESRVALDSALTDERVATSNPVEIAAHPLP
jgi:hypothetical protein